MKVSAALLAALVASRAAAAAPEPVFGNAPYDAAPARTGRVKVEIDFSAAEQILQALSEDKLKPGDPSSLQSLPAVRRAVLVFMVEQSADRPLQALRPRPRPRRQCGVLDPP